MQNLFEANKRHWTQIRLLKPKFAKSHIDAHSIGVLMESLYLGNCYAACYNEKNPFPFDTNNITKLLIALTNTL